MLPRRIGNMIVPGLGSNSRRHGRLACDGMKSSLGTVLDISASGFRVLKMGGRGPMPGESIEVYLVGTDRCIMFSAKVVWARKVGFRKQELGLEYVGMSEALKQSLMVIVRDASSSTMMQSLWEVRKAG